MLTIGQSPARDLALRAWIFFDQHRILRFLLVFAAVCICSQLILAGQAYADDGTSRTYFLPLQGIKDSHGVPIESFSRLPLDYGNTTFPARVLRGGVLSLIWTFYSLSAFLVIAAVNFIVSFQWVTWIAAPFELVARTLHDVTFQVGLPNTLLMITGLSVAIAIGTGRAASGVVQLLKAAVIFAVLAALLATPVTSLIGNGGVFKTSATYGSQLGSALISEDGEVAEDPSVNPASGQLVDLLLRKPALAVSFGSQLSDTCATKFNDKSKSTADVEDVRKTVNGCDQNAKSANETDDWVAVGALILFVTSNAGVLIVLGIFVFFVIKDVLLALVSALGAVANGVLALGPGVVAATAFVRSLLNVALCAVMIGIYSALLNITIGVINLVIGTLSGYLPQLVFGLMTLIMGALFFMAKRRGIKLRDAIAQKLGALGHNNEAPQKPSKIGRISRQAAPLAKRAGRHVLGKLAGRVALGAVTGGTTAVATAATTRVLTAVRNKRQHALEQAPSARQPIPNPRLALTAGTNANGSQTALPASGPGDGGRALPSNVSPSNALPAGSEPAPAPSPGALPITAGPDSGAGSVSERGADQIPNADADAGRSGATGPLDGATRSVAAETASDPTRGAAGGTAAATAGQRIGRVTNESSGTDTSRRPSQGDGVPTGGATSTTAGGAGVPLDAAAMGRGGQAATPGAQAATPGAQGAKGAQAAPQAASARPAPGRRGNRLRVDDAGRAAPIEGTIVPDDARVSAARVAASTAPTNSTPRFRVTNATGRRFR